MDERQMTLAMDWHGENVAGWLASEKIFDCRVYWRDRRFWTRSGRVLDVPKWFTRGLPTVDLDGGIYAGRRGFQVASNAVRLGGHWWDDARLEFVLFDFPGLSATWDRRMVEARRAIKGCHLARAIGFFKISDYQQITDFMRRIRPLGGEGMCFRNPLVDIYETGRSKNLLRFKFINN